MYEKERKTKKISYIIIFEWNEMELVWFVLQSQSLVND